MKKIDLVLLIDNTPTDNEYHEIVISEADVISRFLNIDDSRKALEYFKSCLGEEDNSKFPIPDIIFLDINMPAWSGFDLLDKIRVLPDPYSRLAQMKIFMLSTYINPEYYTMSAEKYGDLVNGLIIKPLTDTKFSEILQTHFPEVSNY